MKKIASIIDNCIDCRFSERYDHPDVCRCAVFICTRMNPQRLAGFDGYSGVIDIPDWCPLETYGEHSEPATEHPTTVVLDCLPHLEWMTENLTGHGDTEIGGQWYYTWDQALAAAAELGDGWRLPTAEEFRQLCDAGSTWVDNGPDGRPGRWFGGNHATDHEGSVFFPASGHRYRISGALTSVGSYGYSWSSSPYSAGSASVGYLYFTAASVNPLYSGNRASGFPVRCVRDISER